MRPPTPYQGSKHLHAEEIVAIIGLPSERHFFDLCCGSGAVSLAAVDAGHPPEMITMVDLSPWGLFWRAIGEGSFDLEYFESLLKRVPAKPSQVRSFIRDLAAQPPNDHVAEIFILLQAAAYSGRPVGIIGGRWKMPGYREPNEPLSPHSETIIERIRIIVSRMRGVRGLCEDVRTVIPSIGRGKAYIDPPYDGKAKYWYNLLVSEIQGVCWVSESRPLSNISVPLPAVRADKGFSSSRKRAPTEEWLSVVGWVDDDA